jgi:hypothetical protein
MGRDRRRQARAGLRPVWSNEPAPQMRVPERVSRPHVEVYDDNGVQLVTVWDYPEPDLATVGLFGEALRVFGLEPHAEDTLDGLRARLTAAALADALGEGGQNVTPDTHTPSR